MRIKVQAVGAVRPMHRLSEPVGSGYMAAYEPAEKPGFPGLRQGALRLGGRFDLLGRGRLLLREVLAGGVGGLGRDDPGRVLGLGRAGVLLAEESAEGLRVDADLLGEGLGRERGVVGHGAPFGFGRCPLHQRKTIVSRPTRHVNPIRVTFTNPLHVAGNDCGDQCLTRSMLDVGTPLPPPRRTMSDPSRSRSRAKRAKPEIFCLHETAASEALIAA